jgi:hypothetical protein
MHPSVIAGILVVLTVAGCASMKAPSPSGKPEAAQTSVPPISGPQSIPPSSSPSQPPPQPPPPPPPVSSATESRPDKSASTDARPDKQADAPAQKRSPAVSSTGKGSSASARSPSASPSSPPTLNLADLEQRLRDTHAIGVFTKLSLKNQVDDLLNAFRELYRGPSKSPPAELRQRYDALLLKVLGLLQSGDPPLAAAIAASREAIWSLLADPVKFEKIQEKS